MLRNCQDLINSVTDIPRIQLVTVGLGIQTLFNEFASVFEGGGKDMLVPKLLSVYIYFFN